VITSNSIYISSFTIKWFFSDFVLSFVHSCDDNETKDGVVDAEFLRHSKVKLENSKVTLENIEISCMKKVDGNWIYNGTTVISKAGLLFV